MLSPMAGRGTDDGELLAQAASTPGARPHQADPESSPPPQQIDAAYWEEQELAAGRWNKALTYWRNVLARPLPKLKAPKALARARFQHSFVLSAERLSGLRDLAKSHKTSLNVLLLDLYARTLAQVPGLVRIRRALGQNSHCRPNTCDRTDCWVLCGCLGASRPLPSSIDVNKYSGNPSGPLRRPCQSSTLLAALARAPVESG